MKEDLPYLLHIVECIRRIEENTSDGRDAFLDSHTVQDAVIRNLQTLSESTQRLSSEIKSTQDAIEWRLIGAFRNVLVHNYLGIDLDQIWKITQHDLPKLRKAIDHMISLVNNG